MCLLQSSLTAIYPLSRPQLISPGSLYLSWIIFPFLDFSCPMPSPNCLPHPSVLFDFRKFPCALTPQFTALQMLRMEASPSAWALKEPSWPLGAPLLLFPGSLCSRHTLCSLFPAPLQYASFPLPPCAALLLELPENSPLLIQTPTRSPAQVAWPMVVTAAHPQHLSPYH